MPVTSSAFPMLEDFPVHLGDNWKFVADAEVSLTRKPLDKASGSFGYTGAVLNASPLINQSVWVVGDSFTHALREYFHATFKEVHDIDHSGNEMPTLPQELINAAKKPDRVIVKSGKDVLSDDSLNYSSFDIDYF